MGFSDTLRAARQEKGLTQQEVARVLEVDKTTYSGYETGRRQPDVIPRSLARLPLYEKLDVLQIDTSERSAEETAGCLAFYGRYGTMPLR